MTGPIRFRITLSKLMESLKECCREANVGFEHGRWEETRSNLDSVLNNHPDLQGSVFRLYGDAREYLETTIDPETGEPYHARVEVRLHGESDAEAIRLPPFLEEAYHLAEQFCALLKRRARSGFFRTMLLRRMGSTMEAGRRTAAKILEGWKDIDEGDDEEEISTDLRTLDNRAGDIPRLRLKCMPCPTNPLGSGP